jgi:hypothetical protein
MRVDAPYAERILSTPVIDPATSTMYVVVSWSPVADRHDRRRRAQRR